MSLVTTSTPAKYYRKRKSNTMPTTIRWRYVLELHMSGKTAAEIQEITGYSQPMTYRILSDPRMVAMKQEIMKHYDMEFEALYGKVIKAVRDNLSEEADPKVKNDAAKIWLKSHGKFQADTIREGDTNLSAEKIVFQILNQAKEERKQLNG